MHSPPPGSTAGSTNRVVTRVQADFSIFEKVHRVRGPVGKDNTLKIDKCSSGKGLKARVKLTKITEFLVKLPEKTAKIVGH